YTDNNAEKEDISKDENKVIYKVPKSDAICKEVENTKKKVVKANDEKKYCKKNVKVSLTNTDEDNVSKLCSSTGHCDNKKNNIERDKNKLLICYYNISNIDNDKKKMLKQKSKYIEGEELVVGPKIKDENRLIFDYRKLIERKDLISDIHYDEINTEYIFVEFNDKKYLARFDEVM
ncbi:3954_t:CDS:2, partial [Racocetra fulgida]